jgi:hypothetical protein
MPGCFFSLDQVKTSLRHKKASVTGLEPVAYCLEGSCSIQLSYTDRQNHSPYFSRKPLINQVFRVQNLYVISGEICPVTVRNIFCKMQTPHCAVLPKSISNKGIITKLDFIETKEFLVCNVTD